MEMTLCGLTAYGAACRERLAAGAADCLVIGHPAPDLDAVVSALAEAYRRHLTTGQWAVPLVLGTLPREAAWLLGPEAEAFSAPMPAIPPEVPLVLTDHNATDLSGRVVAIVDHHPLADGQEMAEIDACIRPVGAATTLVALSLREEGLQPDAGMARLLLGAILMDTEGLSPQKAKTEDREAAAWLTSLSREEPASLFAALREALLQEQDVPTLYRRDYRLYRRSDGTPLLGFAVLKVGEGRLPHRTALRRLLAEDVARLECPACLAKIMEYPPEGLGGEHYLAAGPAAEAVLDEVRQMAAGTAIDRAPDEVYLPPHSPHRGRKWLAPRLVRRLENGKGETL